MGKDELSEGGKESEEGKKQGRAKSDAAKDNLDEHNH
jgi:hypothetical protein